MEYTNMISFVTYLFNMIGSNMIEDVSDNIRSLF